MQGLLDFIKTPEGQGLLAGAFGYAANAQRGAPINSIGRGGLAGLLGYSNALERQDQQAENQWMQKYRQMQMDKAQYDMDRTKSADAEATRVREIMRNAFTPVSGAQAIGVDSRGPTPDKTPMIGQLPKVDYQALLAQGVPLEQVKALAEAQNFGRQKVARTIKGMGPDGREYEYQVDDYGQVVGDGVAQYRAPMQVDTGGKVNFIDPYKLTPVSSMDKTMTPGERASNALGWANNKVSRDRLAFDQNKSMEPEYKDGTWVYKPTMRNPQGTVVPVRGAENTKPLTESQANINLFGTRALEANKIIEGLSADGVDRPGLIKRTVESTFGIIPDWVGGDRISDIAGSAFNWTQSDAQQAVEQAKRDFINAILRKESGAVIGKDEFTNAEKQYFPQIGDSKAVIEQKAKNRRTAIQGLEAALPGGFRTGGANAGSSGASSSAAPMPSDIGNLVDFYTKPKLR